MPPGEAWASKAAAHAQFYCLLADATGTPGFALLARFINGSLHDLIVQAGSPAEDLIIASHRRLRRRAARPRGRYIPSWLRLPGAVRATAPYLYRRLALRFG